MGLITLCMKKALNTSSVLKQDEKKAFIRTSDKTEEIPVNVQDCMSVPQNCFHV